MKISARIKREIGMRPVVGAGYSRRMAAAWYRKTKADYRDYGQIYDKTVLKGVHDRGYLAKSIEKYNLLENKDCAYITDFDYIFLSPFNNSFSKWFDDTLTTGRILKRYNSLNREVYFSIISRNQKRLVFRVDQEDREYGAEDIISLLQEKKILSLRPAFWLSKKKVYKLEYTEDGLMIDDCPADKTQLQEIIDELQANYLVCQWLDLKKMRINGEETPYYFKFYVANDLGQEPKVLAGYVNSHIELEDEEDKSDYKVQHCEEAAIDLDNGSFCLDGNQCIDQWEQVKESVIHIGEEVKQISYFTVSLALTGAGLKILSVSAKPVLPAIAPSEALNDYLMGKVKVKKDKYSLTRDDKRQSLKTSWFYKFVRKFCRPGIRPYMQRLWFDAVKDDFKNTNMSLGKKIWAWRRGFFSYRIVQYQLTKENYKNFLSDYDYYWLNRINNSYQIWINDKTTFRYILEPFKAYLPRYYFSIFKWNGATEIRSMHDCPKGVDAGFEGIFEMLRREKKLALKPSAGTHGDGFYCLSYENDAFHVNGQEMTEEEIIEMVHGFKSYYLVTEFINMNAELKKIYDKSVNSIRVMVINKDGYNPKIMQAYMRIGSSKTGYTDNVGYGGICVMVNEETGELYNPERIVDHKFEPCEKHPDTGTPISGKIPNWDIACEKILDICRFMPELEYLGFDVAITDDGFQIIEINIHQDLHKVATHSEEIRAYFREKIELKKQIYKIQ